MDKEKLIKAGELLGINTTGELLDPRYDHTFKRIFTASEEQSKIALIDFLNSILFNGADKIKDLIIINNEIPTESYQQKNRDSIYELFLKTANRRWLRWN